MLGCQGAQKVSRCPESRQPSGLAALFRLLSCQYCLVFDEASCACRPCSLFMPCLVLVPCQASFTAVARHLTGVTCACRSCSARLALRSCVWPPRVWGHTEAWRLPRGCLQVRHPPLLLQSLTATARGQCECAPLPLQSSKRGRPQACSGLP